MNVIQTRAAAPRRFGRIVAVLVPALLLSACSGAASVTTPTPSDSGWESTYAQPDPVVLAPLRGTAAASAALAHPSIAVKIDNHAAARPQIGLERADIIFEELVEGGITRYVAVWHSDVPDEVGPVRSIRPMDPDIMSPFGGIAAFSGGAQTFLDMIKAAPVFSAIFDYDNSGIFSRTSTKSAPHNVILQANELVGRHTDLPAPAQQFAYAPSVAASSAMVDGTPISAINTRFSNSRWPGWTWDAAAGTYLRSQEGAPDLDSNGAQLAATNVVTLRVDIDNTYGYVPKTTMIGSGEASVSTGGQTLSATWVKDSQTAPIRLVDRNGVTVRLAPGNTWIELVPTAQGSVELLP
ncbi:hypothetical protein JF66_13790 [Cryobacterium sp. MLB-32]|uniref:DUF3048 domain-containing protein n=1 Tax=Cryobacterium sp. MLB-32 TaxID=1529318 RepID=UPI0004E716E6|nr:DUF3048 domain-containing protein [Cryobacterium sp. MLB-32]KFF59077.1 hypothetical protein JF66_13790 [Cryobacterium sp. MLB-32]